MQIDKKGIAGAYTVRFDYGRTALGGGQSSVCTHWTPPIFTEAKAWKIAKAVTRTFPDATDIGVFFDRYEKGPRDENGHQASARVKTQSANYPILRQTWNGGQPVPGPGWPLSMRARAALRKAWNIVRKCA